ncbi:S-layer family protein, partial [Helicobacter brantae]
MQKSSFKPLIASSLALALGFSVAVATDPTFSLDGEVVNSSVFGIQWTNNGNNSFIPQASDNTSLVGKKIVLVFNSDATNAGAVNGDAYDIKASNEVTNFTLTSTTTLTATSIELRPSKVSSVTGKITTLDLSGVTSGYALVGDFKTGGGSGNTNIGKFGGEGISGSVTLDGSASTEMYFTGNAGKITGALSITQNSTNIISFESGGSIGSFTASKGNSTINKLTYINSNSGTSTSNVVTISGGTNVLNFLDNGVITGNVSLTGGTTTMTNLATINGNIKASGNATLYLSNTEVGNISFDNQTGYNHTTSIFGVKSANSITTTGDWGYKITKKMKIVFADNASVKGKIWSKNEAITELVFSQATSATLKGSDDSAIDMEASQKNIAYGNYSKNVLVFGANTTAKIGTMSTSGDWSGNSSIATFNLLSFNDDTASTTKVTINAISSGLGRNIIGKNLATYNSSNSSVVYSNALFENGAYKQKTFSNPVAEFVKSTYSANGDFALGTDNTSNAISTGQGGANYININGSTTIKGKILSSVRDTQNRIEGHNNLIVLTGTSATLGEDGNAISIKVDNGGTNNYRNSLNTLLLGATQNTLNLSELSAIGSLNATTGQNFNALSINSGTTTATIASVNAGFGTNIIGKDLITQGDSDGNGSGYNTALFGNANTPSIQGGFVAEFVKSTYSVNGNFIFGDNSGISITDAISTGEKGLNYININGTTTIKGNISISVSNPLGPTSGHNNLLVLTGTSTTLGESGKEISIKVDNTSSNYGTNSNNTLLLGADSNTLNLSALSANGTTFSNATQNFNALSFNSTSGNGTKTLGAVSASYGSNIIGANLITQNGGYNASIIDSATIKRNNIASTFMSDAHTAKGTYNITSLTIENIVMGGNYINVENLTITDGVKADSTNTETGNDRFVENYIYTGNSGVIEGGVSVSRSGTVDTKNVITFAGSGTNSISGEISATGGSNNISLANNLTTTDNITKSGNGANYFTFIGNGTLTLQGETNQISTLTAYAPSTRSTSTSTLVIDGTTQANNTTIDSVINGGNLVVNFNGKGETKGATLKISSLTGNTLKSITLGEDSTNNTLDLTALGNTTISEAISVGERQELNINLTNTALTTNGWSNAGTSVINVNGSATANSTLKGGNVELTSLNLNATTSTSMTLQNANTTINTLTSGTATNGNTLALNSSLGNAVNATIESQVDGGNLTLVFNGGEDRSTSLTLNSGDNTFKALSLGSNQSTHNTLNLNSGKTTIEGNISVGNSATQALAFTLKNSTELSLTNGLTTGSNGFTTLRVEDATNGATLSGNGTITLTNLDMVSNSNSSLTFKNTTTTIDTLTSNATDTQINTLIMGDGSSNVTLNDTAKGTKFNLTYNDGTTNGAKTFTLTGGENTIKQVLVDSNDTGTNNTLAVSGGSTTIDTINASGRNLTLALSSDASSPSDTLVTINNAISGTNVSFSGGVNPADQVHFSTLLLKGASNTISSVTTNATNAKIVMKDTAQAEITTLSFDSSNGGSLLFGFEGTGNSTITLGDGSSAITIGDKQTLGISIGGSGTREIKVVGKDSSNITFNSGSTLVVDFQETKAGDNITATLGNGSGFTIEDGSNSIINLRGGAGTSSLSGGVTLDGGNNTVNFIGNAKLSNINLKSGTNTINVYEGITGIVDVATTDENNRVSNVTNIINLKDNSTLQLVDGDTQNASLTSSADDKTNTLNFLGDNATLQGGFGANDGGTATINVGDTNNANTSVNGAITGNVSNAGVTFQTNNSTLTLQGANNTFTTATSNVENAKILMKDTAGAEITSINLNTSGSLIFGFEGTGDSTITLGNGTDAINIASGQTLGISIGGSGTRNLQVIGKNGAGESKSNITFADGSTLLIDFQRTQKGDNITATLGSGGQSFTISGTSKSIINLRGGEGTSQLNGSITLNGGTNTINFLDTATMGDVITLTSGTNIINVSGADSVAQAITGTMAISRVGGVNNTINLGDYSTLKLTDGSEGVGELKTTATNTLNFLGDGATLQGGFGAGTSEDPAQTGTATINVGDSNHSTQVVNGVITGNVTSADVTFKANNSTLTLQGATNTLNALSSTDSTITGTIILDAQTSAGVNATITSAVANNSSVGLKFGAGGNAKTFTFSASGNHLSGVEFDESGSTNNTLSFTSTGNSITSPFEIANNQELIIDLQNSSDLSIAGLSSSGGEANLQSTGTATLKGGEVSVNTLSLLDSTSNALTLQNSSTAIQFLNASGSTSNTLKLDASSQDVYAEIGAITQGNLTASFNGGTHQATLKIVGSGNTLSDLTLGTSSTNNTLSLANGATTISSASGVSVSSNQGITFDLADSTELNLQALSNAGAMSATLANGSSLNITGAFSNTAGTSNITLADNSSLNTTGIVNSGGSTTLILNGTSSITGDITSSDSATTAITLGESAVGKITGDIAFNGTSTA